jgi:hypothetical protein
MSELEDLKAENAALRQKLYAVSTVIALPHPLVELTLQSWHDLLDKQDRERPVGELANYSVFTKDKPHAL